MTELAIGSSLTAFSRPAAVIAKCPRLEADIRSGLESSAQFFRCFFGYRQPTFGLDVSIKTNVEGVVIGLCMNVQHGDDRQKIHVGMNGSWVSDDKMDAFRYCLEKVVAEFIADYEPTFDRSLFLSFDAAHYFGTFSSFMENNLPAPCWVNMLKSLVAVGSAKINGGSYNYMNTCGTAWQMVGCSEEPSWEVTITAFRQTNFRVCVFAFDERYDEPTVRDSGHAQDNDNIYSRRDNSRVEMFISSMSPHAEFTIKSNRSAAEPTDNETFFHFLARALRRHKRWWVAAHAHVRRNKGDRM